MEHSRQRLALSQERTSQPIRERLQMGLRMCGNVGAVDKEKTSLHLLNVPQTVHNPDQISRGGPFLLKKWVLGDHFSTENFGPGAQNFQDQNSGERP